MAAIPSFPADITTGWMKRFLADPFSAGDRIYSDSISERKALELRVIGKRAAWVSRYRGSTTIGYAAVAKGMTETRLITPQEARNLNEIVRALRDRDPEIVKPFLANYYSVFDDYGRRDARKALEAAEKGLARARGEEAHAAAWTLQQAVDNWIEKRSRPDQKKPFKPSYVKEVRSVFARAEFADVFEKPITKLTPKIGEDIRDAVEKNSGISPSKKAVTCLRGVLSYTYEKHRGQSGLEGQQPWWLMLTTDTVINARDRRPELDGVGIVLALGEYFLDHRLPGRTGVQHGVRDNVFTAFLWIVLSAQRVTSGLALKDGGVTPWAAKGEDGWYLATWSADVMKNNKQFVLTIPPRAAKILGYWMLKIRHTGTSKWAFPSEDGDDKKIDRSAPLNFIKRLAARDDKAKGDDSAVDLLALNGVEYWSPHDIRRTLTTTMEAAGMPGAASVVLSHTIDVGEPDRKMSEAQFELWVKNRVAAITGESYGDIQHLKLKGEAMLLWSNAILDSWKYWRSQPLFVDVGKTVTVDGLARRWDEMENVKIDELEAA
ncbi:hypothetical protein [Rhizobium sp. Kim5]|uniref:hypothetical protein n=1 Tax=Rhizobium sp. Kim5 TaxID=2020311 RepID=UPI000A334B18|nr:hypothetical protein [Rhizobium sp. Kim5]